MILGTRGLCVTRGARKRILAAPESGPWLDELRGARAVDHTTRRQLASEPGTSSATSVDVPFVCMGEDTPRLLMFYREAAIHNAIGGR